MGIIRGLGWRRPALVALAFFSLGLTKPGAGVQNWVIEDREVHLAEEGEARVTAAVTFTGSFESRWRTRLSSQTAEENFPLLDDFARKRYRWKSGPKYIVSPLTDPQADPKKSFSLVRRPLLRFEMRESHLATTQDTGAVITIPLTELASEIEGVIGKRAAHRTRDIRFERHVIEWRHRIFFPPGVEGWDVPDDSVWSLGPARLWQSFAVDDKGVVTANIRFDTIKDRYTPQEAAALRVALSGLAAKPMVMNFRSDAQQMLDDGSLRDAIEIYEDLATQQPKKALYRTRIARLYKSVGLIKRARQEAERAISIEPDSANAWWSGSLRAHDLVGRPFGKGYDMAGAAAAFRKSRALDPGTAWRSGALGNFLEHDADGIHFPPGLNLDPAIREYREWQRLADKDDHQFDEHLPCALFRAGRYKEVRASIRNPQPTPVQQQLILATRAISDPHGAIQEAGGQAAALAGAGFYLAEVRQYRHAQTLLEASLKIRQDTWVSQRLEKMRKWKRFEDIAFPKGDPRWLAQYLAYWPHGRPFASAALLSRRIPNRSSGDVWQSLVGSRNDWAQLDQGGQFFASIRDGMVSEMEYAVAGDDTFGYRILMTSDDGSTFPMFIVKEAAQYRMLAASYSRAWPIAYAVLERLAENDRDGARRWLDWLRENWPLAKEEDVLEGSAFPRIWSQGMSGLGVTMEVAAAALLADSPHAADAVGILVRSRPSVIGHTHQMYVDLALAKAYRRLKQWENLHATALALTEAVPASGIAFDHLQFAAGHLTRWEEVEELANERLDRLPNDSVAVRALATAAMFQGQYDRIPEIYRELLGSGKATPDDYSSFAWLCLLLKKVPPEAIEAARMANRQTHGKNYDILRTLGCLYAADGRTYEARTVLLKSLKLSQLSEPDDDYWLGFGLIAEAHGESGSAIDYYQRIKMPPAGTRLWPASSYALAQLRLAALRRVRHIR